MRHIRRPNEIPAREPAGRRAGQAARPPRGRPGTTRDLTEKQRAAAKARIEARRADRPHPVRPISQRVGRQMAAEGAVRRARSDRRRLSAMFVVVVLFLLIFVGQLVNVQVAQGEHWRDAAERQSNAERLIAAPRGNILSRDGHPLAMDVAGDRIVIDPTEIDNPAFYSRRLADVLGIAEATIVDAMRKQTLPNGKQLQYRVLVDAVDANTALVVKDMKFPGVYVLPQPLRENPSKTLAAPVVGGVRPVEGGNEGMTGIESMYDGLLRGRPGELVADKAIDGMVIPRSEKTNRAPRAGRDIVLSLDEGLQYQTEQTLLDQVIVQGARAGSVIAIDVSNGDILAMANVTGGRSKAGARIAGPKDSNRSVVDGFTPGSTMKLVTISKAIEKGCVKPDELPIVVPDYLRIGEYTLRDDESHPPMSWTPREILAHSSNVGTAMIAMSCFNDPTELDAALKSFGFGQATGLAFPGETKGLLVDPKHYGSSGMASNAIGYGLLASPLQVIDAYVAIARGGRPVQPRLMREMVSADGTRTANNVVQSDAVVSAETASTVRSMLQTVVSEGTGVCAAVPGFTIAGKTGTVRRGGANSGLSGHVASFVGLAPANAPRIAVMVMIDDPAETYGGKVAAPVFSEVMSTALDRMKVPSEITPAGTTPQFDQAHEVARRRRQNCSVPHGEQVRSILEARRLAKAEAASAAMSTTAATTRTTSKASKTVTSATTRTATPQSGASSTRSSSTTSSNQTTSTTRPKRTTGGSPPTSSG